jgi:acetoacetyl-CoA synthetase
MNDPAEYTIGAVLRPADPRGHSRLDGFCAFVAGRRGTTFDTYEELWRWSVGQPQEFWRDIWDFFGIKHDGGSTPVMTGDAMWSTRWFPETRLNYAEHALHRSGDATAIYGRSHTRGASSLSWDELSDAVARCARGLRELGVLRGDRIAAYLPNIPETIIAFLASASLGAVWCSCSPELGSRAFIDRVAQLAPKVLFAVDGYTHRGTSVDRRTQVQEIVSHLPTVEATVGVTYAGTGLPHAVRWEQLLENAGDFRYERVPFDHPLYVLFSSGTSGRPKAIVHGHGGILVEHLKQFGLHIDVDSDSRVFYLASTSWMVWNIMISALCLGSAIVCLDGDPTFPDLGSVWSLVDELEVTHLGVSAGFITAGMKANVRPNVTATLDSLRYLCATGAPLPAESYRWVYAHTRPDVRLDSASGGTDVCSAFVGGSPWHDVTLGEIAARHLGADVHAFDADGNRVIGERGELVITTALPSMPVCFWNDPDRQRLRDAYFSVYPNAWRHGDWITITPRGRCVIHGRSDATLNRGGIRVGTAELYQVLDDHPDVDDSVVIHIEDRDELLAVVATAHPSDQLAAELRARIRSEVSPRYVPDAWVWVASLPRTLTGKRLEVPIKRIFQGEHPGAVLEASAVSNPQSLDQLERLAAERLDRTSCIP